ncbi:patched domain-containing protein 3-like [Bacillus rossius redtenbacheri]|uniref:patched domain-containing protein 3-like n=1 Tax=Bacillus rossius redtenbacheri TaxID=93214 RepID=UPI002FDE2D66
MGGCSGLTWVDSRLNRAFYQLGLVVGRHPGYFLVVPVLVSLLCVTGYQRVRYEIDPEYLFSPVWGEGKSERAVVEQFFKPNYTSRFNVGRITRPGRFGRVIVIPKHGSDMLRKEIWAELRMLDQLIQNATATWDGGPGGDPETFTYRDVCARWVDQCFQNDILNLHHVIEEVESKELNLTFPIMFNPVTWDAHTFPVFFGGTVVSDDFIILEVPSVQLVYFVTADTKRQDARGAAWEETFLRVVGEAEDSGVFQHISTARFASRTLDIELERNTRTVVPFFSTTFLVMAAFSVTSCMMADWVRSKPWLGFLGNVSACMGTAAAFGVAMYLGIEFIGINLAAPFLMLGIGIDDTFVMLAAWRRSSVKLDVPERMAQMLSEAAVSITITSFTDMISFFIGIISPFPSVRIFCAYSGFAVFFTFLWHITFFAACVAVAGRAEQKNLHSVVCVKVQPVSCSDKRSWLYRMFCSGGINPDDPDNPLDNTEHGVMAFFRDTMAALINRWPVKVLVIAVFALYLAGAGYGVTRIKEGLERRKLSRADSYSVEFYDREDFYFREFPYRIQVVISGQYDYSDPEIQQQVENLTQSFENTSFISSPLYTESWLRSFVGYIRRNQDYLNVTIDTEKDFIKTLKELWLFKPNPFSLDVKFNENETEIIASRFLIQAVNISDSNGEKEMVRELRKICRESPLNATVFHPYFVFFDQFELVRPTAIQSMIIGALIMMLVCFVFIPNISCCLWVAFSIISIETGVAGYMALWDVNLDSISMINLIMCIGFSVDFTAHICYAYMSSKATTPEQRVRESLYALGLPIVQGAFSTILAVVTLIFAGSYIFLVFFKMVFLVVFFGAMHGLFLLPVLLSLFGPGSCTRRPKAEEEEDEKEPSAVEKTFPHPFYIPHPSLHPSAAFMYPGPNGESKSSPPFFEAPRGYHVATPPRFGIPLPGLPSQAAFNKGLKYAEGNGCSTSLEKDLGLGTSGEDSSESSSNKSQRRLQREAEEEEEQRKKYEEGWRKTSAAGPAKPRGDFQPLHIMEVYNSGYVSEDEGRGPRHAGKVWYRGDKRANYHDDPPKRHSPQRRPHPKSQHRPHSRSAPGYVVEMKFP